MAAIINCHTFVLKTLREMLYLFFDIHSHILPKVDDGARNLNESLKLLKLMQEQGITAVLATPHFYPNEDSLEHFKQIVYPNFKSLKKALEKRKLPEVYLGCELLYFNGISNVSSLKDFCLNGSKYLLLELTDYFITPSLFKELQKLRTKFGITPIIAHAERYHRARNYKKFIEFLQEEKIPVQINASSFEFLFLRRAAFKLLNSELFCVIATDTHSLDMRPPKLDKAFYMIEKKIGNEPVNKLIDNSNELYKQIILQGDESDKNI